MFNPKLLALALASVVGITSLPADPYARTVISYHPGSGTSPDYNNPDRALGEPARVTPGFPSGSDSVTPFNPAWPSSQLVSIGAGGSLTLQFGETVLNGPENLFGLDFIVFGNNGFTLIDFSRNITDGSLFTFDPPGSSRVLVSFDDVDYFELVAPASTSATVDGLFPADSTGNFQLPVNPALTGADFAGQDLAGIRELYAGSGGGTGFDLAWARNTSGEFVALEAINYLRVEVVSGKVEIDGVAIVPEPEAWALLLAGTLLGLAAWPGRVITNKGRRISTSKCSA